MSAAEGIATAREALAQGVARKLAFHCTGCGMETHTDDFAVIGRNCPESWFERPHKMEAKQS